MSNIEDHINTEYIDVRVDFKLRKDLQKNEEVCQDCKGVGVRIYDAKYGLTIDGVRLGGAGHFPFNKQSIVWCGSCYNGVRKRCEFCDELVDRRWVYCQCDKSLESRGEAPWQKELALWNKAEKISYKEAVDKYEMVYVDNWSRYISTDTLEEEFEYWADVNSDGDKEEDKSALLNLRIFGTSIKTISFDADWLLENSTEELHDEAYERSKHIISEMQETLNTYAEKLNQDTTTYYMDETVGILLSEEDIKNWSYFK